MYQLLNGNPLFFILAKRYALWLQFALSTTHINFVVVATAVKDSKEQSNCGILI